MNTKELKEIPEWANWFYQNVIGCQYYTENHPKGFDYYKGKILHIRGEGFGLFEEVITKLKEE